MKICSHVYGDKARLCWRILGYDTNVLYLSTMLKDMPCSKGQVVHHENHEATTPKFAQ